MAAVLRQNITRDRSRDQRRGERPQYPRALAWTPQISQAKSVLFFSLNVYILLLFILLIEIIIKFKKQNAETNRFSPKQRGLVPSGFKCPRGSPPDPKLRQATAGITWRGLWSLGQRLNFQQLRHSALRKLHHGFGLAKAGDASVGNSNIRICSSFGSHSNEGETVKCKWNTCSDLQKGMVGHCVYRTK